MRRADWRTILCLGVIACGGSGTNPGGGGGGGNYTAVAGEDWTSYANDAALMAAGLFGWGTSGSAGPIDNFVDLVADGTFGKVVRITQPLDSTQGYSPQMHYVLAAPLNKAWFRFRIRFAPGWTTVGSGGISQSNAYKVAHMYMPGGGATGRTKIEIENTANFDFGFSFPNRSYTETLLAGNTWGPAGSSPMTTEESDNQWYEFILYHQKTGVLTGEVRAWRRRLTTNGAIVNNPFVFVGWTYVGSAATDTFPKISSIALGINKNRSNDQTQYLYWGPWEIVDGSQYPDPWGVGP